jgi:hypothetical protein
MTTGFDPALRVSRYLLTDDATTATKHTDSSQCIGPAMMDGLHSVQILIKEPTDWCGLFVTDSLQDGCKRGCLFHCYSSTSSVRINDSSVSLPTVPPRLLSGSVLTISVDIASKCVVFSLDDWSFSCQWHDLSPPLYFAVYGVLGTSFRIVD